MRYAYVLTTIAAAALIGGTAAHAADSKGGLKQVASYAGPEDFSWVKRDGYKLPAFKSEKPRYTLWALGDGRKSVMLMAWDESQGTGKGYDTFYFDKNFNGDLTEAGESFTAGLNEGASFETGAIKEADGARSFSIKYVRDKDNFGWQSGFGMGGPNVGYNLSLLPGNLKIRWTEDLKSAPVYRFGGEPMIFANGKKPGDALGKWGAGGMAGVHLDTFICGNDVQNQLKFYHSQLPGAGDPKIMLRVLDTKGAAVEDIPFAGGCGCAGSFGQELLVPLRVPPGKHTVAVRVNRAEYMGGPVEYLFPVEVENPDFGKPLVDPAYQALKAKAPGAKIVSLRRAAAPGQDGKGYPEENVVAAQAFDDTLYGNTRDWNMSNVNQGGEPFNGLGTQIHHHNDSRTLMKFDLSAMPKAAKISGAQLRITLSNQPYTGTKGDAKVQAFAVLKEWAENESCWNAAKKGGNWSTPGCDGAGSDRVADPSGSADISNFPAKDERFRFVAIDLTDLVKQWVTGQQANHGVLLKLAGGGCVKFCSNEFQDYPFRPELLIALDGGGSVQASAAAPAGEDLEAALAAAKKAGKPLAVKFYSPTCGVCRAVEAGTFADADVKKALGAKYQYVSVKIEDRAQFAQDMGVGSVPALVILQPDGKTRAAILGSDVLKEKEKVLKALADPEHAGADAGGGGGCSARALAEWDKKLQERLAEATKGGKRLRAFMSPLGGKAEAVSVTGADEKGLHFEMKGNKLELPWSKVVSADRLALADALAQAGDGAGNLLAGVMLQCIGNTGEAENRFAQAIAADPKLTKEKLAELKKDLKQP